MFISGLWEWLLYFNLRICENLLDLKSMNKVEMSEVFSVCCGGQLGDPAWGRGGGHTPTGPIGHRPIPGKSQDSV